jgi:hypothetical protein
MSLSTVKKNKPDLKGIHAVEAISGLILLITIFVLSYGANQ